jgi:hypothetical protein
MPESLDAAAARLPVCGVLRNPAFVRILQILPKPPRISFCLISRSEAAGSCKMAGLLSGGGNLVGESRHNFFRENRRQDGQFAAPVWQR